MSIIMIVIKLNNKLKQRQVQNAFSVAQATVKEYKNIDEEMLQ